METNRVVSVIFQKRFNIFFFDCFYAKFLWCSIHILYGIVPPTSTSDLFESWSKQGNKKLNTLLLTAAAALLWAIWISRNEIVFDKCKPKSFLQVLFRGTHWLHQWASLQRLEGLKDQLVTIAVHLETSALAFFSSNGRLAHRHVGVV